MTNDVSYSTRSKTAIDWNKMKTPATIENESDDEVLIDTTEALTLRSKKTSRLKRKLDRKSKKKAAKPHLLSLYPELIIEILSFLAPSDVILYQRTCRTAKAFIEQHDVALAKAIISSRYAILTQCFPAPVLLRDVDSIYHEALLSERRQKLLAIHRRPYAHVSSHDPSLLCSCLTCVLAWNNLCLLVDLHHWTTTALAKRQPIPMIPRGQRPEWNVDLVEQHAQVVRRAVHSPLWYALILQRHLQTTIFGIRRYAPKDETPRFQLDDDDVASGTDAFCARKGPPSYEFPLHRDAYYGLQTYLPNRLWKKEQKRWGYQPADQHFKDLEWVKSMADRARTATTEETIAAEHEKKVDEVKGEETEGHRDDKVSTSIFGNL